MFSCIWHTVTQSMALKSNHYGICQARKKVNWKSVIAAILHRQNPHRHFIHFKRLKPVLPLMSEAQMIPLKEFLVHTACKAEGVDACGSLPRKYGIAFIGLL